MSMRVHQTFPLRTQKEKKKKVPRFKKSSSIAALWEVQNRSDSELLMSKSILNPGPCLCFFIWVATWGWGSRERRGRLRLLGIFAECIDSILGSEDFQGKPLWGCRGMSLVSPTVDTCAVMCFRISKFRCRRGSSRHSRDKGLSKLSCAICMHALCGLHDSAKISRLSLSFRKWRVVF